MKHHLTLLDKFLYTFRELFIYHHDSLEFRAKIYTLIIMANDKNGECEFNKLEAIVEEIYPKSLRRQNTFILTVKEYIDKIIEPNGLGVDELIFDIEKHLKREKRYRNKINIEHLKEIIKCTQDRESIIYQNRIIEFLEKLKNGSQL